VLGTAPPANVVVNEMMTVASIWTHNQFIEGTAIKGPALSLKIAAGNVPNFVDLATGGWGEAIQGPLNSNQTTTMANFATIADGLSGCIAKVTADACDRLFEFARGPTGAVPTDTLRAVEAVARYPSYRPERLFALLDAFYPIPPGRTLRPTPRMPYLSYAPSAWVLPLKFGGGGLNAPGKIMFDGEGNAWTGVNFSSSARRRRTSCGTEICRSSRQTEKRCRLIRRGFRAAGSKAPASARPSTLMAGCGSRAQAARQFRSSTRTASRLRRLKVTTSAGKGDARHHRRAQRRRLGARLRGGSGRLSSPKAFS
jgi:hypothetical protein